MQEIYQQKKGNAQAFPFLCFEGAFFGVAEYRHVVLQLKYSFVFF